MCKQYKINLEERSAYVNETVRLSKYLQVSSAATLQLDQSEPFLGAGD